MSTEAPINAATTERLKKEIGLLLRTYRAELAKDTASHARESARSNLILYVTPLAKSTENVRQWA